jgi:hypothetical protein
VIEEPVIEELTPFPPAPPSKEVFTESNPN